MRLILNGLNNDEGMLGWLWQALGRGWRGYFEDIWCFSDEAIIWRPILVLFYPSYKDLELDFWICPIEGTDGREF